MAIENENTRVKRAAELLELKQEMEKDLQRRRDQTAEEKRRDREQVELGSARDAAELERIKAYEEQARLLNKDCPNYIFSEPKDVYKNDFTAFGCFLGEKNSRSSSEKIN